MTEDIEKKSVAPKDKDKQQGGRPQPIDPQEEMKIDSNLGQPSGSGGNN